MNYVFISPAYPVTCTSFCDRLNACGVTVLGIGDVPYDELNGRLKQALTEYYYVDSLEDWLRTDARLRTDFNIATGTRQDRIDDYISKSRMKDIFISAGVPTARQHIVSDLEAGREFAAKAGYPVIVKPQKNQSRIKTASEP